MRADMFGATEANAGVSRYPYVLHALTPCKGLKMDAKDARFTLLLVSLAGLQRPIAVPPQKPPSVN